MNLALVHPRLSLSGSDRERLARSAEAARALARLAPRPRPERLSGIHNPWGLAAGLTDCWTFLDLAEATGIVAHVARVIGPDVILWDSVLHLEPDSYRCFVAEGREGRYWPADPLAGAVVLMALAPGAAFAVLQVPGVAVQDVDPHIVTAPLFVARYMPATSRYRRDLDWLPNRCGLEEQPLINYMTRPLWLVRGVDRAGNDFVTGFAPAPPRWAGGGNQ